MFTLAKEMWDKLCLSYEQKSEQHLKHLYLELLEYKKDLSDSAAMHVSKLEKLCLELVEESFKVDHNRLSDTISMIHILNTMPSE